MQFSSYCLPGSLRAYAHALGVVFADAGGKGQFFVSGLHLFGHAARIGNKNQIDVRHTEIGLKEGVDDQGTQLFSQCRKARRADAAEEQPRLPTELHKDPDGEEPRYMDTRGFVLLPEVIHDQGKIADEKNQRHITVILTRGTLNDDRRHIGGGKRPREQRADKPPQKNQERPCKEVLVFREPEPNPCEIRKAVAHGHPQKHPEQAIPLRNAAGMADQMKDAEIHDHIKDPCEKTDKDGHIFLFP